MILDLGLIDYEDAYRVQREFVARRLLGEIEDSAIVAEHKSVFTIGRTGSADNLLFDEGLLTLAGIKVLNVDRGGDITYHGPGQITIYPVIDLRTKERDLHRHLRNMEQAVIDFLAEYSVFGRRINDKTGVWIGKKKIASIGVGCRNWVTYHGTSVNINTDLRFFSMINPCGMKGVEVTSLGRLLGREVDLTKAKNRILSCVIKVFNLNDESCAKDHRMAA
jgi:lipoate-protein ligase B